MIHERSSNRNRARNAWRRNDSRSGGPPIVARDPLSLSLSLSLSLFALVLRRRVRGFFALAPTRHRRDINRRGNEIDPRYHSRSERAVGTREREREREKGRAPRGTSLLPLFLHAHQILAVPLSPPGIGPAAWLREREGRNARVCERLR